MTFSEYILGIRYRLHDIRDNSGTVITDASKDGIRWTSALIQQVAKSALTEMSRTLLAIGLTKHINESIQIRKVQVQIAAGTGIVNNLPGGQYKVLRIAEAYESSNIYDQVDSTEYLSKVWRNRPVDSIQITRRGFVQYYDEADKKIITEVTPISSEDITAFAMVYVSLENLFAVENTDDLPFINVNDIMLDYAEMEGRRIEHNPQQREFLWSEIQRKLQELQVEEQRNNR